MVSNFYAGIGSRQTPSAILGLMREIAKRLAEKGMILRSGGADGADTAFEQGVNYWHTFMQTEQIPIPKEIFYAWHVDRAGAVGLQAMKEAAKYHGAWNRLSPFVRKLHARNAFQILGLDLKTPVLFVICWTKDGCFNHDQRTILTGGTGTAISIASMRGIPVFNLAKEEHIEIIRKGLDI